MLPALFLLAALLLPRKAPAPKWGARLRIALRELAPFWSVAVVYLALNVSVARTPGAISRLAVPAAVPFEVDCGASDAGASLPGETPSCGPSGRAHRRSCWL